MNLPERGQEFRNKKYRNGIIVLGIKTHGVTGQNFTSFKTPHEKWLSVMETEAFLSEYEPTGKSMTEEEMIAYEVAE